MFTLVSVLISLGLAVIERMLGTVQRAGRDLFFRDLPPTLAVGVRRLHDAGRSGWWVVLGVIPVVGAIVLLVFLCQDSVPGDNEYGPNPRTGAPVEARPAT